MKVDKFLGNTIKYCIPSVFSALLSFAVLPLISRVFPAEDYGKINLFYSVGNMLQYVCLMDLDSAYIRFYFDEPEGIKKTDIFSVSFWSSLLLNVCATGAALCFFADRLSIYLFGEKQIKLLMLLSVYVFSLVLFRLFSIESRMEGKTLLYNVQQVLLVITNRVSYVLAALVTTNYQFSLIIITCSTLILSLFFLKKQKKINELAWPHISKESYRFLLKFSLPLLPATIMTWLNNSAAKMLLSGYGDFGSLGVLSIATSLANIFSLIPSAFCVYWAPFMYKNYKEEQPFIKKVHNYILLLSIVLVLGFFVFQDLIYLIIGEEYRTSQSFFMLIMLTPIQSILCETTSYGLVLANKTQLNLYVSILTAAVNIVAGMTLYPLIGVYGVVIGIALAAITQLCLLTIIGQRCYKSIVSKWQTIFGFCAIVLVTVSNLWLYKQVGLRSVISIVILGISVLCFREEVAQGISYMKLLWARFGKNSEI